MYENAHLPAGHWSSSLLSVMLHYTLPFHFAVHSIEFDTHLRSLRFADTMLRTAIHSIPSHPNPPPSVACHPTALTFVRVHSIPFHPFQQQQFQQQACIKESWHDTAVLWGHLGDAEVAQPLLDLAGNELAQGVAIPQVAPRTIPPRVQLPLMCDSCCAPICMTTIMTVTNNYNDTCDYCCDDSNKAVL